MSDLEETFCMADCENLAQIAEARRGGRDDARDWRRLGAVLDRQAARIDALEAELAAAKTVNREVLSRENDDLRKVNGEAKVRIEALETLLADKEYIQCKADYNRGHLSHAGWLDARERTVLKGNPHA